MKLQHYLLTEGRTKHISEEEFMHGVVTSCSDIIKTYKKLDFYYRGLDASHKFAFVDPSNFERTSANTANYYTILMDNLPNWKSYPKRSKSIVFSNDKETGASYGNSYIVFPKNGAKIGQALEGDIWYSFPKMIKETGFSMLTTFNDYIDNLCNHYKIKKPKTYEQIKAIFTNEDYNYQVSSYFKNYDERRPLWDQIVSMLDPVSNKFKLINPKTPVEHARIHELWTDSDCYITLYWQYEKVIYNLLGGKTQKSKPKYLLDIQNKEKQK